MSQSTDADGDTFALPDVLTDGQITDTRRELLQLLYDHPDHRSGWYTEKVGVNDSYITNLRGQYPGVITKEEDPVEGLKGTQHAYRLTDRARRALLKNGTIEEDAVSEMANRSEEPSQTIQRGNVKFTGRPIDVTDLPDGEGPQTITERPVKGDPSAESAPDDADGDASGDEAEDTPDTDDGACTITLDAEDVFTAIRTADESVARQMFSQVCDE